ncbi:MAG: TIM barrel protein [Ilumatobacteraceae bacterium]
MTAAAILPGLCSVTFRQLPIEAVALAAAEAGLLAIEWGADVHVPPGDAAAAHRATEASARSGITITSYGSYLQPSAPDGEIATVLDTAAALGARTVRVWTPFGVLPDCDPETWVTQRNGLTRIAAAARDRGLQVGLEFHGWTLTHTAASANRLLDEVGAANLHCYWQPVYWVDELLDDSDAQLAQLHALASRLAHLHVYWWRGRERHPLADGQQVWPAALAAAAEVPWSHGPRVALLEFVPDDDPRLLGREAAQLLAWLAPGCTTDSRRSTTEGHQQ